MERNSSILVYSSQVYSNQQYICIGRQNNGFAKLVEISNK